MGRTVIEAQETGETLRLPAPAKINLFLHVTGRRDDGYHVLESVFVPISLADTVTLRLRRDGVIRLLDAPHGLTDVNDLACRAARALQTATGTTLGVDIQLNKRIPQGAGLGGGSSDAASTLLGLNRLWKLRLSRCVLSEIGLTLGADVPFFVFGQPAWAQGIGDALRAVTLPMVDVVVARPGAAVATQSVFAHPELTRDSAPMQSAVATLDFGRNDLQPVATLLEPRIDQLLAAFVAADAAPRMTGSGSCVFALAHRSGQAKQLHAQLTAGGWQAWAVRTLAAHPLRSFANGAII